VETPLNCNAPQLTSQGWAVVICKSLYDLTERWTLRVHTILVHGMYAFSEVKLKTVNSINNGDLISTTIVQITTECRGQLSWN
jgi:hypothetical protein